jgi:nanoRNase/pAp phosphatase (c-di-AMP/oligoRNAs hydrolase)
VADVGGPIGSTSTLLVSYFRASGVKVPPDIATALFYGIKADTRDLGRQTTSQDVDAYLWLFPLVDKEALAEIEHPKLPAEYFRLYHVAIERALVYEDAVVCDLADIYAPDMVAEVAERFMSLGEMRWSLAFGEYEDAIYYSIRTGDRRINVGRLIREVIESRGGSAGGHGTMAGARLPVKELGAAARKRLKDEVVRAFLDAFGVKARKGKKLV